MFAGMSIRSIRYMRAKESDIVSNPELVYENILKVAQLTRALNWNGLIVGMTDCTKIRLKLIYSDELGCVIVSTLKLSETSVQTYDDIHKIVNILLYSMNKNTNNLVGVWGMQLHELNLLEDHLRNKRKSKPEVAYVFCPHSQDNKLDGYQEEYYYMEAPTGFE
jgi:hypothetical protein